MANSTAYYGQWEDNDNQRGQDLEDFDPPTHSPFDLQEPNGSLIVKRLLFIKTRPQQPMFRRPFTASLNHDAISSISECVADNGVGGVTSELLAPYMRRVLHPSAEHQQVVPIPEGWEEPRMRFVLVVEHREEGRRSPHLYYFQGYTDTPGIVTSPIVSRRSHVIDPELELYFNSYCRVVNVERVDRDGRRFSVPHMTESAQILANDDFQGILGDRNEIMMRPRDVVVAMYDAEEGGSQDVDPRERRDRSIGTGHFVTPRVSLSRRANNVPAEHATKLLTSFLIGRVDSEFGQGMGNHLGRAKGYLGEEPRASENPFLRALNYGGNNYPNHVSYKTLVGLFPEVEARGVTDVMEESDNQRHSLDSERWSGAAAETLASMVLLYSVPALVLEQGLDYVVISSTNEGPGGRIETLLDEPSTFSTADQSEQLSLLIAKFNCLVGDDLALRGDRLFNVVMWVDTFGETRIRISLDMQPFVEYSALTCTDARFSPVVTTRYEDLELMAYNMGRLGNYVSEECQPSMYRRSGLASRQSSSSTPKKVSHYNDIR